MNTQAQIWLDLSESGTDLVFDLRCLRGKAVAEKKCVYFNLLLRMDIHTYTHAYLYILN